MSPLSTSDRNDMDQYQDLPHIEGHRQLRNVDANNLLLSLLLQVVRIKYCYNKLTTDIKQIIYIPVINTKERGQHQC